MAKKTKEKPLTELDKQARVLLSIKTFQKLLGLGHWTINTSFDGTWNWNKSGFNTIGKTTTRADYFKANIKFHEKVIPTYYDNNRECLDKFILHELIHTQHSPFLNLHNETVDRLTMALKGVLKDRYNSISEQITSTMEKVLLKEYKKESEALNNL